MCETPSWRLEPGPCPPRVCGGNKIIFWNKGKKNFPFIAECDFISSTSGNLLVYSLYYGEWFKKEGKMAKYNDMVNRPKKRS